MSHLSSAVDTNYVPRWKSFQCSCSVFVKLLFTHWTRISSAVINVVLPLGVTDFYQKFTFVLSSRGDRLDVKQ